MKRLIEHHYCIVMWETLVFFYQQIPNFTMYESSVTFENYEHHTSCFINRSVAQSATSFIVVNVFPLLLVNSVFPRTYSAFRYHIKAHFTLELRVASYVSLATLQAVTPQFSFHIAATATSYVLLRYTAQFCKSIYKFTTHSNVALRSRVQDTFHYIALQTQLQCEYLHKNPCFLKTQLTQL